MKLLKQWYDKFIKDMEKANKESFGDKKLGCCGLNSDKSKKCKCKND
ncbi:LDCC motif putative metal-binding protein [Clostridium sp.]